VPFTAGSAVDVLPRMVPSATALGTLRRRAAKGHDELAPLHSIPPQARMGVDCHTTICQPFVPFTHTSV
jgi:hypothetical protein